MSEIAKLRILHFLAASAFSASYSLIRDSADGEIHEVTRCNDGCTSYSLQVAESNKICSLHHRHYTRYTRDQKRDEDLSAFIV
jgi:hypothetical protein